MNREDIVRMAREAGFHVMTDPLFGDAWLAQHHEDNFYKFAALVAAAEREACAQLADDPGEPIGQKIAVAIRARGQI